MSTIKFYTPTPEEAQAAAQALRSQFPSLWHVRGELPRITRAVAIASRPGAVKPSAEAVPGEFVVLSESNEAGEYKVSQSSHSCTCPDHGAHAAQGIICKHRLAVKIWQQAFTSANEEAPVNLFKNGYFGWVTNPAMRREMVYVRVIAIDPENNLVTMQTQPNELNHRPAIFQAFGTLTGRSAIATYPPEVWKNNFNFRPDTAENEIQE